jgi:hypothetical protein
VPSLLLRLLLAFALASAATQAAGQAPEPVVQTGEEALAQDAADYARRHDVAPDEAVRRLRAQEETVAATDRLQALYARRLAGISIEHEPDYRIVVLLTGSKPVPDQIVEAAGMAVPIVFRTGAPATRARILEAIEKKGDRIRAALPAARGMGADPRTGELVVMLSEDDKVDGDAAAMASNIARIAGVPTRIRLIERPDEDLAVEGGARVVGNDAVTGRRSVCTVGFVVSDGARSGIVTAAHRPDVLT